MLFPYSLQRQWFALQELVNHDGIAKNITNETLQSIRNQISPNVRGNNGVNHVQRTPSAKRNYFNKENMTPLVEQSQVYNFRLFLTSLNIFRRFYGPFFMA